ncbi:GUN4 domain-containing protein [Pleurocapsa sp. PCC 7319]|uniref:GUN4 domain-containing protein n=1 Tax=Pleurocapsa sp. PCC 7319 TaxID=118161 RepID=UPI00034744D9|nr:GUN4 domain-containing protein [Pleurocapsa sp. PCC 7319]
MPKFQLNRQTVIYSALAIISYYVSSLRSSDSFLSRNLQRRTLSNFTEVVEVEYSSLRNLLAAEKWREADEKTKELIFEVRKVVNKAYYLDYETEEFSCSHFKQIDALWVEYSDGRFGFSVQKPVYIETGNNPEKWDSEAAEAYIHFADRVGWRKGGEWLDYQDLKFNISAPLGHLPKGSSSTYETYITPITARKDLINSSPISCM